MSVLDEIRKLDEQKAKLLEQAKAEALKKAEGAIAELNALGFNYKLSGGGKAAASTGTGKRRTGVREDVLSVINDNPKGITRAKLLEEMGAKGDTSFEQSVSNAVSNLKKAGKIKGDDGTYMPA